MIYLYTEEMDVYMQALDKAYATPPTPTTTTTTYNKSGAGPKKEKGLGQPLVAGTIDITAIDMLLIEALPFTVRYVTDILLFVLT